MARGNHVSHEDFVREALIGGHENAAQLAAAVGMKEQSVVARIKRYADKFGTSDSPKVRTACQKLLKQFGEASTSKKLTEEGFEALFDQFADTE